MTTWTQKYLKEAITDEIALAALHPRWKRRFTMPPVPTQTSPLCVPVRRRGFLVSPGVERLTFSTQPKLPPRWRRNWEAAGELSTEFLLSIRHDRDEGAVSVGNGSRRRDATEAYADHPSVDAATWAAIVRAAIQHLAEMRDNA